MLCASLKRWVNHGRVDPSLTVQWPWAAFSLPPGPRLSHVQSWATLSLRSLVVLKLHISQFLPLKKKNAPSGIVFSVLYLERGIFSDKHGSSGRHDRRGKGPAGNSWRSRCRPVLWPGSLEWKGWHHNSLHPFERRSCARGHTCLLFLQKSDPN